MPPTCPKMLLLLLQAHLADQEHKEDLGESRSAGA